MLRTEQADPRYAGLDTWNTGDILQALWQGQMAAVTCVQAALPALGRAAEASAARLENETSRLIYAGAGASGQLAIQDGMEMTPTYGFPLNRLVFLMAGGDDARLSPIGVVEDDTEAAARDFEIHEIGADDVVVAVAASGGTPYTVELATRAKTAGALIIAIANNADTALLDLADIPVLVDSGPEVIAGSTRLGAGTAQKAALGILSTLTMIRLGHVVDGFMVSVVADNIKLRARAGRILCSLTGAEVADALTALDQSEGQVKTAALLLKGHSLQAAAEILHLTGGDLRQALAQSK